MSPGDNVKIWERFTQQLVNLISVAPDNIGYCPQPFIIWDGHNYDNVVCVTNKLYWATINDGPEFNIDLNPTNPGLSPVFTDVGYQGGVLNWKLAASWASVRCSIYDSDDSLVSRVEWDRLVASGFPQSTDVSFLPFEQEYTARFYAWRQDGAASSVVNHSFYHPCPWLVGDADASGVINVSDGTFLLA